MTWLKLGAWMLAAAITAGAFGAHGLEERLAADRLELWETAARYLAYAGLAVLCLGSVAARGATASQQVRRPALLVAVGGFVFSSTVFALALGGPGILGAITPLGGAGMIVGLVWFALSLRPEEH